MTDVAFQDLYPEGYAQCYGCGRQGPTILPGEADGPGTHRNGS